MQNLISRRNVRQVKMFLVTGYLEKFLLASSIITFLLIEYNSNLYQVNQSEIQSFLLKERLSKSLSKVSSLSDWYSWLSEEFAPLMLNKDNTSTSSQKHLLGSPRIFNIYLQYPPECLDQSNIPPSYCVPLDSASIKSLMASSIPVPSNKSLCIDTISCSEFTSVSTSELSILSHHIQNTITLNPFTVSLPSSTRGEFQNAVTDKLSKNQWMSPINTRCFGIEFSVVYAADQSIRIFQLTVDNWLGAHFVNTRTAHVSNFKEIGSYLSLLCGFYMIVIFLGELKMMMECTYIYKQRFIFVQLSLLSEIAFVVVLFLENSSYNQTYKSTNAFDHQTVNQSTPFIDGTKYMEILEFRKLLVMLNFIFIPFKIFNLFAWIKSQTFFVKFANTIFRSFYSLTRALCMISIMYISWTFAIYNGLKTQNSSFESFPKALISFFSFSSSNLSSEERKLGAMNMPNLYFLFTMSIPILRGLITLLVSAIVINSLRMSQDLEFDLKSPFQQESLNDLSEICLKLDKFEKQTLSIIKGKDNKIQGKIIIWLQAPTDSARIQTLVQRTKLAIFNCDIKLIEFGSISEIHEFLQYLFNLKPNLLYQSQHYFRIILDFGLYTPKPTQTTEINPIRFVQKPKQRFLQNEGINPDEFDESEAMGKLFDGFERFLWLLNDRGATVPVMFNCKISIPVSERTKLLKIYHHLHFASEFSDIREFATLLPIDPSKQSTQKPLNVRQRQSKQVRTSIDANALNYDGNDQLDSYLDIYDEEEFEDENDLEIYENENDLDPNSQLEGGYERQQDIDYDVDEENENDEQYESSEIRGNLGGTSASVAYEEDLFSLPINRRSSNQ